MKGASAGVLRLGNCFCSRFLAVGNVTGVAHAIWARRRQSTLELPQLLVRFRKSGLFQVQFACDEGLCISTVQRYLKVPAICYLLTGAPSAATATSSPRRVSEQPVGLGKRDSRNESPQSGPAPPLRKSPRFSRARTPHGHSQDPPAAFRKTSASHDRLPSTDGCEMRVGQTICTRRMWRSVRCAPKVQFPASPRQRRGKPSPINLAAL